MPQQSVQFPSRESMTLLSRLLLVPQGTNGASSSMMADLKKELGNLSLAQFEELLALANSNHVIVRGMEVFLGMMREAKDETRAEWAQTALAVERARISTALKFLQDICTAIEDEKHDVTVIKSLDHLPDLGSDVDLYTNASRDDIAKVMKRRFSAEIASRSWGDRLACKWNFMVPGLPEAVEIHMGRLGQTGEQIVIASRLAERSRLILVEGQTFRVTSTSDRLMISTLQRMYRHFYFRLCDIVDSASLADMGAIDYEDLRSSAEAAGIWEGVATYLLIVSDYVEHYRGKGLDLPSFVRSSAQFRGDKIHFRRDFLRVPILPESAALYAAQLTTLLRNREFKNSARLSLLPYLATAAAVGMKITGSDKGIW
jgi:hypothetical protein